MIFVLNTTFCATRVLFIIINFTFETIECLNKNEKKLRNYS